MNTTKQITEQEIFNKVWEHFVVNKAGPSINIGGCAYRGDNGTKCAVGVLLTDEEIKQMELALDRKCGIEGLSVDRLPLPPHLAPHENFLTLLQRVHDGATACATFSDQIKLALEHFAEYHKLTIPPHENPPNT